MSGLEHVDFSDGSRDARLVAVVRDPVGLGVHEVGGQEGGASEGGDFRSPPHEVGVGCSRDLVLFFGVEGDQLHVHVAERDVGVVAVDVLDELGAVGCFGPVGGPTLLRRVSLRASLLVPIMGMMLGAVVSAVSTFVALETNTLQSVSVWFQGSFTSVYEGQYEVLWIVAIVVAIVFIMADRLTAISLGEDIAVSLGVNYHRMILIATGLVAVATGVVTVVVGSLPFLGLIVPNLVSMSMGDNLRTNLPWVCLAGIALVTVTDLLARTLISPFEMPVSVILGVLGAFVFIALVLRQAKKGAIL